ncbi:MAG TPA: response regulator transcription factor [Thermoanaerobaculia bacterium]|nr:response regulator transcription factor [Thermoanaerobaculia bacterium]
MRMEEQLPTFTVNASPRVLVADPEREMREVMSAALEARRLEVWSVAGITEAWKLVEQKGLPHAAVVELGYSRFGGVGFCERVRRIADLPIVATSLEYDIPMIVRTLDQHADDFVRKPFAPAELAARVVALLRRVPGFSYTTGALVRVDDELAIDFGRRTVVVGERRVTLTPTETKILYLLVRSMGHTVESRFMLARLWPTEEAGEETLRAHVYRLRSKIEPGEERSRYITTVRGVGYRFAVSGGAKAAQAGSRFGDPDRWPRES